MAACIACFKATTCNIGRFVDGMSVGACHGVVVQSRGVACYPLYSVGLLPRYRCTYRQK